MIDKLVLKNFKKVKDETFHFQNFDLVVGSNNSGKSTALQALAIWQYCVDQFRLARKKGSRGIQIVLPNFTALPLPEFNLLWTDRTDREYKPKADGKTQLYIYIEIDVFWTNKNGEEKNFNVQLRYQSPQSVYAIPKNGWINFTELDTQGELPRIVYVPPFSGLEPHEQWIDDGNIRQNVGKAQPGSVLRNLLFRVVDRDGLKIKDNKEWQEISTRIKEWFGVELIPPKYEKGISTEIRVEYKHNGRVFDIISGGSGFHQILTLLAFFYGYPEINTILFDEPDAHLHINLQRKIISYFKQKKDIQFIIATHSEEFIKGTDVNSIISVLSGHPHRIVSNDEIIEALSNVDNIDIIRTQDNPYILYIEGEDDERLLSAWANILNFTETFQKFYPYKLCGTSKHDMKDRADKHYKALKQVNPTVKRILLFDYDDPDTYHPPGDNIYLNEWKRKNIDNYLFVPDAWKRALIIELGELFASPLYEIIDNFFSGENLTLPPKATWKNVSAKIFEILDGKQLLFEQDNSLYKQLIRKEPSMALTKTAIASAMTPEEIHNDVELFFSHMQQVLNNK